MHKGERTSEGGREGGRKRDRHTKERGEGNVRRLQERTSEGGREGGRKRDRHTKERGEGNKVVAAKQQQHLPKGVATHGERGAMLHAPPLLSLLGGHLGVLPLKQLQFLRARLTASVGSVDREQVCRGIGDLQQHRYVFVIARLEGGGGGDGEGDGEREREREGRGRVREREEGGGE